MEFAEETLIIAEELRFEGIPTTVSLYRDGTICWNGRCFNLDADVLGFCREGSGFRVRTFLKKESTGCFGANGGYRMRKDFVFEPPGEGSLQRWCDTLREHIDSLNRPKNVFVIVNPFGGIKSASKIFCEEVEPLLVAAEIQYTVQETQFQLHAKEIANSLDLSKYDGIVCISGDGILVEVVNGLLQRTDWDSAIKMPLGVIPAGTGNGMAKSLMASVEDPCVAANAIFAVIRGHKQPLDVATISQGKTRFFSVLMLAWGLIADIDIESEIYRWMGSVRIDFYGILRIMCLRKYNGCIYFVPAPGHEAVGDPVDNNDVSNNLLRSMHGDHDNDPRTESGYPGPSVASQNWAWRTIGGPFISVWLHNVPWATEDTMPAPAAKFSDGYLDLILVKDCPRAALVAMLTKMKDGGHVKSEHVLYIKVKAFCLEPGQRVAEPEKGGIIDSDGEVLARGEGTFKCNQNDIMAYGPPIHITIHQGLATLFSPN
ncbi:sphingosine kinase 2 isoform X1 [Amborella trichopoda]|uniref:sphingosine kinase n=2 Tax=Amborella trichopoda TaxID=13333 RepID=W1P8Z6_AMBTC|nr:sphingosine kinase 2 isoform X1 [Amborella trichopoda]ERN03460.1 hypothetical protein AMTR_s00003p00266880 [Amborella trichopoda]|eukprot:XP_006841785.1 sphingosine kinase 2 isoform X1 [Amborella trichopoda]